MKIGEYLRQYQPIAYKVLENAVSSNRLSHAYLLVGEPGIPLKEISLFFAKSILCDNPSPLACEKCLTCLRIEDGTYADVLLFDGNEKTIKKEDVEQITSCFSRTALEEKGKTIYIINIVENMTIEAVNSLLKFLEEPGKDIYAILTTENESKVLPTIISRAQGIRFQLIDKRIIIEEAKKLDVPDEDAELLANFYNNADLVKEEYNNKSYQSIKAVIKEQLDVLLKDRYQFIEYSDEYLLPLLKSKELTRIYLDMLSIVFQDLENIKIGNHIILESYDTILKSLCNQLHNIDQSLLVIMNARTELNLNLNIPLLIDKVMIQIIKE